MTPQPTVASTGAPRSGDVELASLVADLLDGSSAVPSAFGIALVDGDETLTAVAGTVSATDATAVPLDARFHLGSGTKAMTAVALASVLDERGFGHSSTLGDVLPDVALDPAFAELPIAELIAHRAGIVDEALPLDLPSLSAMPAVAARDIAAHQILSKPPQDPGRAFAYSNAGYTIAGWISEQLTGQPWREVVQQRVFAPLGMTCGFGSPTGADEPIGHDAEGVPDEREDTNPELIDPAGRVSCSMVDWAAWARAMLDIAEGRPSDLLSDEMAAQLLTSPDSGDYASGWVRLAGPDGAIAYGHDGSNTHWLARILIIPAEDRALLIAANDATEATSRAFDSLVASVLVG